MKKVLVLVIFAMPFLASAQTNKIAPFLLEKNRVWDSIGANHRPVAAEMHYAGYVVICTPIHPTLHDKVTVYYDPSMEVTPLELDPKKPDEVKMKIRKGNYRKTITFSGFGPGPYNAFPLEPKALEAAAKQIRSDYDKKK